jgi:16S rRNA (guanine527-N7)-methyltransferase
VTTVNDRMENIPQRFDFVVSRAVSSLPAMQGWLKGKIIKGKSGPIANGLIYIKGGDFETELKEIKRVSRVWNISEMFDDPFFETKKVVWLDLAS